MKKHHIVCKKIKIPLQISSFDFKFGKLRVVKSGIFTMLWEIFQFFLKL